MVIKCSVLWNVLSIVRPRLYDPFSHNFPTPAVEKGAEKLSRVVAIHFYCLIHSCQFPS